MKKPLIIIVIILLTSISLPTKSYADEISELKSMIENMGKQLVVMQQRINELETEKKSDNSSANDIIVSLKPTPKFKSIDGSFEAKIIGFVQADAVFHNDDTVDHPDSTTIKRARVGLAGKIFNDWGYKFLYDFGNNIVNPLYNRTVLCYNS